ncbi:MAG: glycosyltransferase family 2 protein [Gammaproteobacteria bacterium]
MPKISGCIISFNEEAKLEDCLQSLAPVVDEIVIVDSLSTDGTVEIARRYTDKVYDQKFLGHIEQKNLAVSKASHDWILSLDCDERLDDELTAAILRVKDSLDNHGAYRMARKTFYVYRWLNHCWYPDRKVRLFNRNLAKWGGTNPHDVIIIDENVVHDLPGDIQHYSFDSISAHVQTLDKFTEIAAGEIIRKGKRVTLLDPFTHSVWAFIRIYFVRGGFRDGFAGFVASWLSGVYAFVKYTKVIFHQRQRESSA